ncbi:hypothetical protein [Phenylobacterium sp.]|uniref:hypothetical protein n=1 Tax=Phenylobacterium sp. TaxID=1871053 RepID=UPI0025DE7129|nr:hypothetical protein [Phenylobacterium sp.]
MAALSKLPDEALQSLLDKFAEISAAAAANPGTGPKQHDEHRRWQLLSAALKEGRPGASASVRGELNAWVSGPSSPFNPHGAKAIPSPMLTRGRRLLIAGLGLWTVFVFYRTSSSHTLAGIYLQQWDEGDLISNWLVPPAIALGLYLIARWVAGGGGGLRIGGRFVTFKRPSSLRPSERMLHLIVYPLLLVPLGIYLVVTGMADESLGRMLLGGLVGSSPFWVLLRLREASPNNVPARR